MNPIIICGGLAGAMTVDAAITGCCERADSQTPVLGVAGALCGRKRASDDPRPGDRGNHLCRMRL